MEVRSREDGECRRARIANDAGQDAGMVVRTILRLEKQWANLSDMHTHAHKSRSTSVMSNISECRYKYVVTNKEGHLHVMKLGYHEREKAPVGS